MKLNRTGIDVFSACVIHPKLGVIRGRRAIIGTALRNHNRSVFESFKNAFRDEDNILDQMYRANVFEILL